MRLNGKNIYLSLLKGDRGEQGEQGIQGEKGDCILRETTTAIATNSAGINVLISTITPSENIKVGDILMSTANTSEYNLGRITEVTTTSVVKVAYIGTFKGEKGEQGEQGIQGEKGEQGIQGIQGIQGAAGKDGVDGANITKVEAASPIVDTEYNQTRTPIRFMNSKGQYTEFIDIYAKNGAQGEYPTPYVLWEGAVTAEGETMTLAESIENYEMICIEGIRTSRNNIISTYFLNNFSANAIVYLGANGAVNAYEATITLAGTTATVDALERITITKIWGTK